MPQLRERYRREAKRAALREKPYAHSLEETKNDLQQKGIVYDYDGEALRCCVPMALTEQEFAYSGYGAVFDDLVKAGIAELSTYVAPDGRTVRRWAARVERQ